MIILGRELAETGLRNVAASRGVLIPASPLGKGKMVSQVTAIFLLLLSRPFPLLEAPARLGLWVVVGLTVLSGVDYFWRFGRGVLRGSPSPPQGGTTPLSPPPRPVSSEVGRLS
jgi:phosphatidylglycerophosphate synthase